jgi:hypothetical protein
MRTRLIRWIRVRKEGGDRPRVVRLVDAPIIRPHMDGRMGANVNGPSLIRVPDWLERPLGRYYLYFGHHDGRYIRLAHADDLLGPWSTHGAGVLPLAAAGVAGHVASPDAHVDTGRREIRMYFHGSDTPSGGGGEQLTRVATSRDGLTFATRPEPLGLPYFRAFRFGGWWYALAMPGVLYRSRDGLGDFEEGPTLFGPEMRHSAVRLERDRLQVFYTNAGDCPERILLSTIELRGEWREWRASPARVILEPEREYEGGDLPLEPSRRGLAPDPVRELRDPAIFEEDGRTYLLYSVAGEQGIALAEILA